MKNENEEDPYIFTDEQENNATSKRANDVKNKKANDTNGKIVNENEDEDDDDDDDDDTENDDDPVNDNSDSEEIPMLHRYFPRVRPPPAKFTKGVTKELNLKIKEGKFSSKEDKQIINNFNMFLDQHDLEDNSLTRCGLLGFAVSSENEDYIKKLKALVKPSGFYFLLARRLPNRLISAVYNRARKILQPFRKQSELSESEKNEIIEAAKAITDRTNMYSILGQTYNCDPQAVRRIIERTVDLDADVSFLKGRWRTDETMKLLAELANFFDINITEITPKHLLRHEIPWPKIAKAVGSRCGDSCRSHVNTTVLKDLEKFKEDSKLFFREKETDNHKKKSKAKRLKH